MPVKKGKQAKQAKPKAKQSRKDHLSLSRAVVEESNDAEPQQPEDDVETVEKVKPGQKPKRTLDNTTADEDEMRLEALLFSDIHATEYDGLAVTRQAAQDVSEDEEDIDFANMDFIIDRTGSKGASNEPAAVLNAADVSVKEGDSDKDSGDDDDSVKDTTDRGVKRSVWEDADDHAIEVAMASKSRTRKLRKTEAEDVVDGSEYSDRLREQFKNTYSRTHQKWAEHVEEDVDGSELMGWSGKLLDGSKQGVCSV
ncbi:hypothetical protein SARC_09939 [Sphaeroforma arctica JP610]|uniref:Uncharacterized protein n=1 Tax=Sphaeroforma arctica JP610 TaxID=667725 RepID=A0A0L0FNP6_9EUKA|nr:hypothetical protein SARC_09939 [Sphaeroforma arctica JP610]KNC77598.1 hypothetical protein SARC_09939 [Sphaeroforma arctica JP610]|eukprot:XP_014151500.1 hypothetical protein SARC_09939 [Sphaeroforma arctica JP610]